MLVRVDVATICKFDEIFLSKNMQIILFSVQIAISQVYIVDILHYTGILVNNVHELFKLCM